MRPLSDRGPAMKYASLGVLMLWSPAVMAEVPALCADAPNQAKGTLCAKHKLDAAEAALAKARDALQAKLDPTGGATSTLRSRLGDVSATSNAVLRPVTTPSVSTGTGRSGPC